MMYDLSPLFRAAAGIDRLASLVDTSQEVVADTSYPPHNIAKIGENAYRLTMAVAGFGADDIELTVCENRLVIVGRAADESAGELLYRGIPGRSFERRFALADHVVVDSADLRNGLLHVTLKRVVPEALKPRRIAIGGADTARGIANDTPVSSQAA